jgi:hypothetical protein
VVVLRTLDDQQLSSFATQVAAQNPLLEIVLEDPHEIGAEFVRWEYATALAGHLLGVNPFDEPNVTEAKETTAKILEGTLVPPRAVSDIDGIWVTYAGELEGQPVPSDLASALRPLFESAREGDYFGWLAYLPDSEEAFRPLRDAASLASRASGRAVCLETGPRYLHSTGQLHKGGPNSGIFLVITARDRQDMPIPGASYSLGQLFRGQAEGDLVTLAAHARRTMRLDLPDSRPETLARVTSAIKAATGA